MLPLIRSLLRKRAFSLVELLTVMAVIAILAGLVLSIAGYVNSKAARARAEAEIKALSAGCESYRSDHGGYPHQQIYVSGALVSGTPSDVLDPRTNGVSLFQTAAYTNASLELYEALTGDIMLSGTGGGPGVPNYITDLRADALGRNSPSSPVYPSNTVAYLSDPFGNVYGYSTANATAVASGSTGNLPGFNPTYDMWSTGGSVQNPNTGAKAGAPGDPMLSWIKNW